MRINKCDRCKKSIKGTSDNDVSLIGFHGAVSSLDFCVKCAPKFVKMVSAYTNKKVKISKRVVGAKGA